MTITPDQAIAMFRANRPASTENLSPAPPVAPGQWNTSMPSRGFGDTIAKVTHATGLDRIAKVYTKVTGKPCGCHGDKGRQGTLNRWMPYNNAITKRHLLYHVYPDIANEIWRANLRQLKKRWDVFNGRRLIAVALGPKAHTLEVVQKEMDLPEIEWLPITNDPRLREVVSFRELLKRIKTSARHEACFFAHSKGNCSDKRDMRMSKGGLGIEYWRNAMYAALLDNPDLVMQKLSEFPSVGTTIITWKPGQRSPYPSALNHGQWMYAGTFFWFRCDAVFSRERWSDVPDDRWGAEAWISGLFPVERACSLYQPWPIAKYPTPSPYRPEVHTLKIRDS